MNELFVCLSLTAHAIPCFIYVEMLFTKIKGSYHFAFLGCRSGHTANSNSPGMCWLPVEFSDFERRTADFEVKLNQLIRFSS